MPELPDVVVYVEALQERVVGQRLRGIRLRSPFVLRSVDPPIGTAQGRVVSGVVVLNGIGQGDRIRSIHR